MSAEELKIRGELEVDVERDLEAEIKDGIYHLALRLHRLYQHQKERNEAREVSELGNQGLTRNNKTLSELNINIRMEGGIKIEIKEIKKEARENGQVRSSRWENMHGMMIRTNANANAKKFDWAKSLRSEPRPLVIQKKNNQSPKVINYEINNSVHHQNHKPDRVRRNWTSSTSGQSSMRVENKFLELGWKC